MSKRCCCPASRHPMIQQLAAQPRWQPATRRWPCSVTRRQRARTQVTGRCSTATSKRCWPGRKTRPGPGSTGSLRCTPLDRRLWRLAARPTPSWDNRLQSHRAQAEAAALSGNLVAAIEQISLGIKAGDGSFHEMSAAEARRREWQEPKNRSAIPRRRTRIPSLARLVGIYPDFLA
jgi:hypothetical protein